MSLKVQEGLEEFASDNGVEKCGIIMPISASESLSADHWQEVLGILNEVVKESGFDPKLFSNADEEGIIQKSTVQSLLHCPISIFDVSGKNPGVMFKLGVRLAFDKPTIIIKDEATTINFELNNSEYITYPKDFRYSSVLAFKEKLRSKIKDLYKNFQKDPDFSTFFKEMVESTSPTAGEIKITTERYLIDSVERLSEDVRFIKNNLNKEVAVEKAAINGYAPISKFTDIFLRPDNLEIFVSSKIDQYVQEIGLKSRQDIEKQRLQNRVFEYISSNNPELDNDVMERLILEVINRKVSSN